MNIEIVKEINLAELVEKVEDTNTIAGVALAFAIISIIIIALFIYVVVTVSNGQDKDIKDLEEECKRLDYLFDRVDDLRSKCDLVYKAFVHRGLESDEKEAKELQEKCDILSKRMDNLVDMVNHHDE